MSRGRLAAAPWPSMRSEINLSGQQIVTRARNSFDACLCTGEQRGRWKAELETAAAAAG